MSLAIDVDQVTEVLLADGWHYVFDQSFTLDAYEFFDQYARETDTTLHGGGQSGVCATGFQFKSYEGLAGSNRDGNVEFMSGPLTAILAVKTTQA